MTLELLFIEVLLTTAYQPIPAQTKPECKGPLRCWTSTNEPVHEGGVAISQDLLCTACRRLHHRCNNANKETGKLHYGDYVWVAGLSHPYKINDVMGLYKGRERKPQRKALDILVTSHDAEASLPPKKRMVWKITRMTQEESEYDDGEDLEVAMGEGWHRGR